MAGTSIAGFVSLLALNIGSFIDIDNYDKF